MASKSETGGFLDRGNPVLFFQKMVEAGGVGIFKTPPPHSLFILHNAAVVGNARNACRNLLRFLLQVRAEKRTTTGNEKCDPQVQQQISDIDEHGSPPLRIPFDPDTIPPSCVMRLECQKNYGGNRSAGGVIRRG